VEAPNERGRHMRIPQIEVIAWAVEIRRHQKDRFETIFTPYIPHIV
jgi:hypothetical protein